MLLVHRPPFAHENPQSLEGFTAWEEPAIKMKPGVYLSQRRRDIAEASEARKTIPSTAETHPRGPGQPVAFLGERGSALAWRCSPFPCFPFRPDRPRSLGFSLQPAVGLHCPRAVPYPVGRWTRGTGVLGTVAGASSDICLLAKAGVVLRRISCVSPGEVLCKTGVSLPPPPLLDDERRGVWPSQESRSARTPFSLTRIGTSVL